MYKDVENKGVQRLFLWGMEKKRPHNIDFILTTAQDIVYLVYTIYKDGGQPFFYHKKPVCVQEINDAWPVHRKMEEEYEDY